MAHVSMRQESRKYDQETPEPAARLRLRVAASPRAGKETLHEPQPRNRRRRRELSRRGDRGGLPAGLRDLGRTAVAAARDLHRHPRERRGDDPVHDSRRAGLQWRAVPVPPQLSGNLPDDIPCLTAKDAECSAQGDPQSPVEARPFFDNFSWQTFVAMVWPSDPAKDRGQPISPNDLSVVMDPPAGSAARLVHLPHRRRPVQHRSAARLEVRPPPGTIRATRRGATSSTCSPRAARCSPATR